MDPELEHWIEQTRVTQRRPNRRYPNNRRFLRGGARLLDLLRREARLPRPRVVEARDGPVADSQHSCEIIHRPAREEFQPRPFVDSLTDRQSTRMATTGLVILSCALLGLIMLIGQRGPQSEVVTRQPIVAEPLVGDLATTATAETE